MILPITIIGNAVLRKKADPVPKDYPNLKELVENMFETMRKSEGVGLAAPQVGLSLRLFVIDASPMTDDEKDTFTKTFIRACINPEIVEFFGNKVGYNEGCLSVPGRQGVVTRPRKVKVQFQNRKGEWMEIETEGFEARAICHELDHLDGKLYIDVMDRELTQEEIEGHIPEDDNQ